MNDNSNPINLTYTGPTQGGPLQIFQTGVFADILPFLLTPTINTRKDEWLTEVGRRLQELNDNGRIKLDTLNRNEDFVDTAIHATTLGLRDGDKEKISFFQNAIINTALADSPDKTLSRIFLNLIDSFTAWHIKILSLFDNPQQWFKDHDVPAPTGIIGGGLTSILYTAYPQLQGQREMVDLIWSDLGRAKLHNSSELGAMMTGNGLFANRSTSLGKQFLHFISNHESK